MERNFSMVPIRSKVQLIPAFLILFFGIHAQSWGNRGHYLICEAAIHLLKEPELKSFLIGKIQAITYLCNLPDTYWRNIKGTESGNATHFFEPDLIGLTFESIPLNFSEFEILAQSKTNLMTGKTIRAPHQELGSSWWRAQQLSLQAKQAGLKAKETAVDEKDNPHVYTMWVLMGLLGHFVGDNAQPLHTTMNYDGWLNGHGGLHSYYETDLVNALPPETLTEVLRIAPSAFKELSLSEGKPLIEKMRQLSILSHKDLTELFKLDKVIKPSQQKKEKGMDFKTDAERKSSQLNLKSFKPLLIKHLARGAALTAYAWEQIFREAKAPPISKNKSYQFPHQYEFIPPNYLNDSK